MTNSKGKERWFKLIIISFSVLLFYAGLRYLLWSGWVVFEGTVEKSEIRRYKQQKKKSTRVLVLGDSQLERWPVDHCLYRDLGKYCHQQDWGYVNAAHHGFSPIEYLNGFRQIAPDYRPDLTIVFYYAGNDLTDVLYREGLTPKLPSHGNVTLKPMEQSVFYRPKAPKPKTGLSEVERQQLIAPHPFNWEQFRRAGIDEEMIRFAENRIINSKTIGSEYVNPHILVFGSWKPDMLYDNLAFDNPGSFYAWYQILGYFETLVEEAEQIGSKVAFVCIPSTVQVDTSHYDFYRRTKFRIEDDLLDHRVPQDLLNAFSKKANVPYVDLLPSFKAAVSPEESLYFDLDDHLNNEGHRIASEKTIKQLLEPYRQGALSDFWQGRTKGIQADYIKKAVAHQINVIRSTPNWFAMVEQKAMERGISLDSALYQDAVYVLSTDK
ncbi:MAG: SGNH/GDSL hydrolase family protein [Bacteroidota bacterium]